MPLWHPPEGGYAGGFYRARRLVEQMPFSFDVTDTDTTDLRPGSFSGTLTRIPASALFTTGPLYRPMRALNWLWTLLATIGVGLRRCRHCDVVYVPCSEILPLSLAGCILARLFRIPMVLCNLNAGKEGWALNRRIHDSATQVVAISHSLEQDLRARGVTRAPIALTGMAADDGSLPLQATRAYDAIYLARHTEEKGAFDAVEIWARVRDAKPDAKLAMVGPCAPDMERHLRRRIAEHALERNVELRGPVSEEEKWRFYATSRVCLFPSRVEGWGIVPIEAHFAGLPVVAARLPAYEENVAHSPAATLCAIGDYDAFARAVLRYEDFDGAGEARAWARAFSWPAVVARDAEIIREALRRGGYGAKA